jgi:hypothetical protein
VAKLTAWRAIGAELGSMALMLALILVVFTLPVWIAGEIGGTWAKNIVAGVLVISSMTLGVWRRMNRDDEEDE